MTFCETPGRVCTTSAWRPTSPEQFDAALAEAADRGAAVVQQGVMPGGIQFAYVSAPQAGVPFMEIAYVSPEMQGVLRLHQTGADGESPRYQQRSVADTVASWSDDVDVVVIGFGIGGGCAAVSAAAAGARVLVLERAAAAGGTTSLAGGHFYLGGGTAVQQATGHADSPEEMYKYLVAVSRQPDHDKIRAYCDGSVEHFNWLEDLGFQFERSYFPGKAVIQPNTEGLMLHRQREGVAVPASRRCRRRAGTRCRCPATPAAPAW